MIKILFWNVRGVCSPKFLQNLKLACRKSHPGMILLTETKSEDEGCFRCLLSLGFDEIVVVSSLGRSGGIVAAWQKNEIDAQLARKDRQFLQFQCKITEANPFMLTAIYAHPSYSLKQELWGILEDMAPSISLLWVLIGDFNDIGPLSKKVGGLDGNEARIKLFNDRGQRCALSDIGYQGPKFTWRGPKLRGCRRLYERLDRALVNEAFLMEHSDWELQVLPRINFSDHNPICLAFGASTAVNRVNLPFRFEAMWGKHEAFKEFLSDAWGFKGDIHSSLDKL
ncbi:hypothetical protein QN277_012580 [Acacia crassicarpa]|uniref:Endonuclease/exonuclease/phosphatase domain-containing protein n=1 Tax=Acacia crassicarpa TaxID=499986 RepID=A0AAE1N0P4_9FABA|nr:hypothetical protein QN277_012580 [Acacia crassicarpa]